jgi:enoyl-CoA hydratase/carnithine racemase
LHRIRLGIVQEVVAAAECNPRAVELAQRIAAQAPLGVQAVVANVRHAEAYEERREAVFEGN